MDVKCVDLGGPDDPRWDEALSVLQELRPNLTRELLEQVLEAGASQGLRFTALVRDGRCAAVAGWRIVDTTSVIRKLYVDDLATAQSERSTGCGSILIRELMDRGRSLGCRTIELDSGVQRHGAHRFYLRERFEISSHHFQRSL